MSNANAQEQVESARKAALVIPEPEREILVVRGSDRLTWLNGQLTCDLGQLSPGSAVYGLATTQKGRILADLIVFAENERLLCAVPRAATAALRASFEHYLVMEDVEIESESLSFFSVHGPRSADVLDAARRRDIKGGLLDQTGLGGAFFFTPSQTSPTLPDSVESEISKLGCLLGDSAGWEALRLECGVPRYGDDFDAKTYPQEASLEKRAVSFSKGCYLGQEVVCMLEMRGRVKRKLVPIVLLGKIVPPRLAPVLDAQGVIAGEITSASMSPTLGVPVALAMVKVTEAESGRTLRVGGEQDLQGRVVEKPVP